MRSGPIAAHRGLRSCLDEWMRRQGLKPVRFRAERWHDCKSCPSRSRAYGLCPPARLKPCPYTNPFESMRGWSAAFRHGVPGRSVSFAPSGLAHIVSVTHSLRCGLHSFAALRLAAMRFSSCGSGIVGLLTWPGPQSLSGHHNSCSFIDRVGMLRLRSEARCAPLTAPLSMTKLKSILFLHHV